MGSDKKKRGGKKPTGPKSKKPSAKKESEVKSPPVEKNDSDKENAEPTPVQEPTLVEEPTPVEEQSLVVEPTPVEEAVAVKKQIDKISFALAGIRCSYTDGSNETLTDYERMLKESKPNDSIVINMESILINIKQSDFAADFYGSVTKVEFNGFWHLPNLLLIFKHMTKLTSLRMMKINFLTRSGTLQNVLVAAATPELSSLHYDCRGTADFDHLKELIALVESIRPELKDYKIIHDDGTNSRAP